MPEEHVDTIADAPGLEAELIDAKREYWTAGAAYRDAMKAKDEAFATQEKATANIAKLEARLAAIHGK